MACESDAVRAVDCLVHRGFDFASETTVINIAVYIS